MLWTALKGRQKRRVLLILLWRLKTVPLSSTTTLGGIERLSPNIQCILVSHLEDGRYLAAFPQSAWHRQTQKRALLPILSKPLLVEVMVCHVSA